MCRSVRPSHTFQIIMLADRQKLSLLMNLGQFVFFFCHLENWHDWNLKKIFGDSFGHCCSAVLANYTQLLACSLRRCKSWELPMTSGTIRVHLTSLMLTFVTLHPYVELNFNFKKKRCVWRKLNMYYVLKTKGYFRNNNASDTRQQPK